MAQARPPSQPALLTTTRQQLCQQVETWLSDIAPTLAEDLLALADATTDRLLQTRQFDLRQKVQRQWPAFVQGFVSEFNALGIDNQSPLSIPDFAGLELVDDAELAQSIVVRELSLRLCESANEALYGLNHRVAKLQGRDEPDTASNPLAPRHLCEALAAACTALGLNSEDRLLLLRRLERPLHQALPPIYEALNNRLISAGILPELRRGYGAPARNARRPELPGDGGIGSNAASRQGDMSQARVYSEPGNDDPWSALQQLIRLRAFSENAFPAGGAASAAGTAYPANLPLAGFPGVPGHPAAFPAYEPFALAATPPSAEAEVDLRAAFWRSLDELQRTPTCAVADPAIGNHPPGGSTTPANATINLVRQVREQQAKLPPGMPGALGHIEAVTIDIVAMLFDFIFDDPDIPTPVKALVSRLQIPVLKTAMLDHQFFADRQHPARQFLDGIAGVCTRWGNEVADDDLLHQRLTELVAQIQQEFSEDPEVFRVALQSLEAVVAEQDQAAAATVEVGMAHIAEKEAQASAAARARASLQPLLESAMPPVVREFLGGHWQTALSAAAARYAAQPTDCHADWERYSQTAADLLWSINAKQAKKDRLRLLSLLPRLLADIQQGLDAAAIPRSACSAFFDQLVQLHAAALKGTEAEMSAPAAAAPAAEPPDPETLIVTRSIEAGVVIEEIRLAAESHPDHHPDHHPDRHPAQPASAPATAVASLKRGDWVEFVEADGHSVRERLNWVSPQRGILMFSNHREAKAISISPAALQRQIEAGQARIVLAQPLFEHALSGVLTELCASQPHAGQG